MDGLVSQGAFLAIYHSGSFRLCRLEEPVIISPAHKYAITWFRKTPKNNEYILSSKGFINSEYVVCEIHLEKVSRFKYRLPDKSKKFIENELIIFQTFSQDSKWNIIVDQDLEVGLGHDELENVSEENSERKKKYSGIIQQNESFTDNVQATELNIAEKHTNVLAIGGTEIMDSFKKSEKNVDSFLMRNEIKEGLTHDESIDNQLETSQQHDDIVEGTFKQILVNGEDHKLRNRLAMLCEDYPNIKCNNKINDFTKETARLETQKFETKYSDITTISDIYSESNRIHDANLISVKEHDDANITCTTDYKRNETSKINILQNVVLSPNKTSANSSILSETGEDSGSDYSPSPQKKRAKSKTKLIKHQRMLRDEKKPAVQEEKVSLYGREESMQTNSSNQNIYKIKQVPEEKYIKEIELNNKEDSFVTIQSVNTSEKRAYDKYHSCFLCHQKCIKMARHLELKHAEQLEIARVLAKPKNSKERRNGFIEMVRVGDFYHNLEVLSSKEGELILSRRPNFSKHFSYIDFGPCPYCLGFMLKRMLWNHVKKCTKKKLPDEESIRSSVRLESNAIVNSILFQETSKFIKYILNPLKNDNISSICKGDNLIRGIGMMLFEKHGSSQNDLIRQTMRQVGRLLQEIRRNNPELCHKSLSFFINPQYFDLVVNSVKSLCGSNCKDMIRTEYGIPSLALKIGHSLRKCVGFLRGQSLRMNLLEEDQTLKSFLELLDLEWTSRISSNALNTMEKKKMNNAEILPLTGDLLKLNKFISREIDVFKVLLQNNPCEKDAWLRLAEVVLARVILFNKRRSGEASRLTLKQFASSPNWSATSTQELQNTLTEFEKHLANTLKLVQITGKRGRTVALILTEDMLSGINLLISTRYSVGVHPSNIYVFARVLGDSTSSIRGSDALRNIVQRADLEQPKSITSTRLRKYIATVSQVFDLKENELDWLARHLGHDIRVHRDFYRLHESAVELTKISRLLMAVDEGKVSQFEGKQLNEINLNDLPDMDIDSDDDEGVGVIDGCNEDESIVQIDHSIKSSEKIKRKSKIVKRKPWTNQEMKAVTHFFRVQIKTSMVPGKNACEECINKNCTSLQGRSWKDVKYCVKNQINKAKKMKKMGASMN